MNDPALAAALQQHQNGNYREAERLYRTILEQNPRHSDALHLLGVLAHEAGQIDIAIQLIRAAIEIQPAVASYHNNLANVLEKANRRDEAQASYQQAIALHPQYADAHYNLGLSYYLQGELHPSIASFRRAIECNAQLPTAWNNLGVALMDLKHYPQAVTCLQTAIKISPDYTDAHLNLGNALQKMGKNAEAAASIHQALKLKPDHEKAWNTLGVIFDGLDDPGAIDCFRMALKYNPFYPEAMSNLGRMLTFTNQEEEGFALLRKAIELRANYGDANWNLALALLLHGKYKEGWQKHEWRWKIDGFPSPKRNFPQPQWQGEDIRGKRLLLHAEQGFGDTIQFSRFLPMVAASGAHIFLEVREPLRRLMTGIPGIAEVLLYGDQLPDFDLHCPLMSLPFVFGTTLDTIPPPIQFPCLAEDTANANTDSQLPLRIGLVWAGNPSHGLDRRRSMPLQSLIRLKDVPHTSFFCVFKGPATAQIADGASQFQVVDLCSDAKDFVDTAERIASLDLVISVDTAVAHLAASLGKPAWLLISSTPDWRWLCDRHDSPWYPSVRIFRQSIPGDWAGVVEHVAKELASLVQQKSRRVDESPLSSNPI
jgi:tetratricopeptide (TPR) repeat protein